jgi:hypothetical protein
MRPPHMNADADAGGEPQVHDVTRFTGGTEAPFGEDSGNGIVDDPHGQAGALRQFVSGPYTDPARHRLGDFTNSSKSVDFCP